jgi:hypothetical protein
LQIGVDPAQTYPQAPQFCASELTLVHVPLQHIVAAGQQVKAPQLPQRRLVLPLQALHAATHWFRFFLLGHDRQNDVHRSGPAAQAVLNPREPSAAPAKTAPMRRSDSRRDTDPASNLDNSLRRSMIDTSLHLGICRWSLSS